MPSARPEWIGLSLPPVLGLRHALVFDDDLMIPGSGPLAEFNNLVINVLAVAGDARIYADFPLNILVVQVRRL
jgi:hypothetical protein